MPINLAKEDANIGDIIYQWQVDEYDKYQRNKNWYIFMGVVGVLLVILGLISANYLFVLIVVLFAIILFLHSKQEPVKVNVALTNTGLILGNKYYRYSEFDNFWIIYNPPVVTNIYFSLSSLTKHRLQIPLLDNDPRPIREHLGQYLTENLDQEEEPLSDRVARLFRL